MSDKPEVSQFTIKNYCYIIKVYEKIQLVTNFFILIPIFHLISLNICFAGNFIHGIFYTTINTAYKCNTYYINII